MYVDSFVVVSCVSVLFRCSVLFRLLCVRMLLLFVLAEVVLRLLLLRRWLMLMFVACEDRTAYVNYVARVYVVVLFMLFRLGRLVSVFLRFLMCHVILILLGAVLLFV